MADEPIDKAYRARTLRSYLRKRRYPQLSDAEAVYRERVKELKLENGTKLIPPANFEGTTYTFCIDFNNLEEIKKRRSVLDRIINNPALKSILE
jgi:hypothetical protein